jgi:hypothetical protein
MFIALYRSAIIHILSYLGFLYNRFLVCWLVQNVLFVYKASESEARVSSKAFSQIVDAAASCRSK